MPDAPQLTPARRKALAVLAEAERLGEQVRVSNTTTDLRSYWGQQQLTVYWQVAGWLDDNGLTTRRRQLGADILTLTATGRQLAEEGTDG